MSEESNLTLFEAPEQALEMPETMELSPMSPEALSEMRRLESIVATCPQIQLKVIQKLFAGMYYRTLFVPKGCIAFGSLQKIPTLLIASGSFLLTSGAQVFRVDGYRVLEGAPGRKQLVRALEDSVFTMVFPTNAKTVEEAEEEFTDEFENLQTRKMKCQAEQSQPR